MKNLLVISLISFVASLFQVEANAGFFSSNKHHCVAYCHSSSRVLWSNIFGTWISEDVVVTGSGDSISEAFADMADNCDGYLKVSAGSNSYRATRSNSCE